jgi:signal peptide peptidase SppA
MTMSKFKLSSSISLEALSRVDSRDMLILPDTATRVMSDMTRFAQTTAAEGAGLEVTSRESLESVYGFGPGDDEDRKPFVYQDGVAVIPVHGTLLNRFNSSWGFVTGFQYIRRMMNAALDDDDVEVIVYDVDSPGGEAAGCFELCREIMAGRRVKPSLAMIDSTAASGGIAIAASATVVYAIPSARVGSIGVYRMHISYEDALKQAGIKVTFAEAGDHKTDGNPYKDLPPAVLNEWTESAKKTWDDFITLIAESRDMDEDAVRDTQARIYRADEALAKGLINAVKTPTEAVAAFLAELADDDFSTEDEEEIEMANEKGKEVTSGLTAADLEKIGAIAAQAAAGVVSAAMGGMQRAQEIKDYAASKGKQFAALASTLVKNDNLTAEEAIAIIDAAAGNAVAAPKKAVKPKKGQRAADPDEDEDDLEGADEDEGDDETDDDNAEDDEDGEEAARAARQGRDKVNHLDRAMKRQPKAKVGGGRVKSEDDENGGGRGKGANRLLQAHASVTGANWSREATAAHKPN